MFRGEVITNEKHPCSSATGVGWGARQPVSRGVRRGNGLHVTSAMPPSHVIFLFGRFSCLCFHHKRKNVLLLTRLRKKAIKSKHHWKPQHLEPVIVSLWGSPWVSSNLGFRPENIKCSWGYLNFKGSWGGVGHWALAGMLVGDVLENHKAETT